MANFVALVAERNHQLQIRDTDLVMKREGINAARGIYEPALVGSYSHYYNNEQNTAEQIVARNSLVYEVEADYYKLEIEGLLPTGAQYKFGFGLTESNDNLLLFGQKEIDRQYKEISYVNLTQPLLKNFGIAATETQIRLAEGDADLAVQSYRQEMLNVVGRAIATYWDLTLAKEKVKLRAESVQVAEKILDDNRARLKTGKMAETEVLEAEAGVALRKALEIDAKKQYVVAENDALTMFAEHAAAYPAGVDVTEPLIVESIPYDYHTSITRAFELRPEYMASQQRLSQERVRLAYAENQRWPELDLKASYGLNGLNYDRSDAWDDMESSDYDTWSVGVELRIPLFGDEKTASELAQVKQRKRKALLEMKAIEVALANAVNTAIRNLKSTTEQADYSASVAKLNNRLLEVELLRLNAGKSNSRLVLEKEDDFRSAREAELEALIDQRKAVLELEMAEGSLLSRYNIDVMERDL
ncbi:MAG: TolC family protein [Desulfuromonadales bacterium]|nr:TolC family protein [Desulfuromonadales bacterium]